jgi:predicted transcriptional regulator
MKRDQIISFKITEELKKQIQELASKEERSVSFICQRALKQEAQKLKKR